MSGIPARQDTLKYVPIGAAIRSSGTKRSQLHPIPHRTGTPRPDPVHRVSPFAALSESASDGHALAIPGCRNLFSRGPRFQAVDDLFPVMPIASMPHRAWMLAQTGFGSLHLDKPLPEGFKRYVLAHTAPLTTMFTHSTPATYR